MERHLERLRRHEIEIVQDWFQPGMRVLDLGGGSGFQASVLASRGCEVLSIDLADRPPSPHVYYPVQAYDGHHIPAPDASFDVVFSSNVLEHIQPLAPILDETRRVLKPEGLAVHIVPSAGWRFWTCITHFPYLMKIVLGLQPAPKRVSPASTPASRRLDRNALTKALKYVFPLFPHGEYPNALVEFYYFRRDRWIRVFERNGFDVRHAMGNRIFYTGYELLPNLPLRTRQRLAQRLGSACHVFILQARQPARITGGDSSFSEEVRSGQRFEFGKNWQRFLSVLDDERIAEAERSLREMLGVETLKGQSFLDAGSGSGLFSLAAMRLGANPVHSFDYDPQSVACTQELKRRYFPDATAWTIEQGDVLDTQYLQGLGTWDIVYSWGVLHHTGDMWRALKNVAALVKPGGRLFISIYNDQGGQSRRWRTVKRIYNASTIGRWAVLSTFVPYFAARGAAVDVLRRKNPIRGFQDYKKSRGMSRVHDWLDWLGGYPFEVAKPEAVFAHYRELGFALERLKTCAGGLGCNEYVLRKL